MIREGTLLLKEPGLTTSFQSEEHAYVRCVIADFTDPTRHFECRVLDQTDIAIAVGEPMKLEVLKVFTDRKNGVVYFDCHLISDNT